MAPGKKQMITLYRHLVRADHFDKMRMNRIMQGMPIGCSHPGAGVMTSGNLTRSPSRHLKTLLSH